jgi:hypothetical protein
VIKVTDLPIATLLNTGDSAKPVWHIMGQDSPQDFLSVRSYSDCQCIGQSTVLEVIMGMWIELGIFGLVLIFGFWQLHDVDQERRKREAQKNAARPPPVDTVEEASK